MSRHSTLTDPDLHEAKGAAAATVGQVLTATGSGTATFQAPATGGSASVVKTSITPYNTTSTGTTTIPFDNTIPQVGEGTEFMTVAYTPTATGNKIRVTATIYGAYSVAATVTAALHQNGAANAIAAVAAQTTTTNQNIQLNLVWEITAPSTSAITFSIRVGGSTAGTFTFNGNNGAAVFGGVVSSALVVTEIKA